MAAPTVRPIDEVDPKHANIVYHDWEAASYDDKWSISFDDRCISYAVGRFAKALDGQPRRFERVLEIGCGTGFFLLNLAQAGYVGQAVATDISGGMVDVCVRNGDRLGIAVEGRRADAEDLPFDDDSFDLVLGHAVVHHLPDLRRAFSEIRRVLRPGGRLIIAGEPTRLGDRLAGGVKWAARTGVRTTARLLRRPDLLAGHDHPSQADADAAALEHHVDQHIFTPRELDAVVVDAGFFDVRVTTEELTANWFGWFTRTTEAMVADDVLPDAYRLFAYATWKRLFWLDEHVLAKVVPRAIFYNAIVTATA